MTFLMVILVLVGYGKEEEELYYQIPMILNWLNMVLPKFTPSEDESTLGTIKVEGAEGNRATYNEAMLRITADSEIYLSNIMDFIRLKVCMYVNVFLRGLFKSPFQLNRLLIKST